jgi:hypothetical protein
MTHQGEEIRVICPMIHYGQGNAMGNPDDNGHLPSHIVWFAYKHQLWPGLCYGLGTMTNDLEPAKRLLDSID